MYERIDWFAGRPVPSLRELREGVDFLVDCYGEPKLKPSIDRLPQREMVIDAHFSGNNGYEGTIFVSRNEDTGCRKLESYRTEYNPDDTRSYYKEWDTDLCIEPEAVEELTPEQIAFFDSWKIRTAKQILGIWEAFGEGA